MLMKLTPSVNKSHFVRNKKNVVQRSQFGIPRVVVDYKFNFLNFNSGSPHYSRSWYLYLLRVKWLKTAKNKFYIYNIIFGKAEL